MVHPMMMVHLSYLGRFEGGCAGSSQVAKEIGDIGNQLNPKKSSPESSGVMY